MPRDLPPVNHPTPELMAELKALVARSMEMYHDPATTDAERIEMAYVMQPLLQQLHDIELILSQRLLKRSIDIMYHAKKLGEEGNAELQAAYEKMAALAPNAEIIPFRSRKKE